MDENIISELISTVGFPITCVIALAYFAFYMVKKSNEKAAAAMEKLQNRSEEREKILYQEIRENREVNAKAIETIAKYSEKLGSIQSDINDALKVMLLKYSSLENVKNVAENELSMVYPNKDNTIMIDMSKDYFTHISEEENGESFLDKIKGIFN